MDRPGLGLGFRVRVLGLGFAVWGLGFRVSGVTTFQHVVLLQV